MIKPHPGNDSAKTGNSEVSLNKLKRKFRTAAKGLGNYCPIKNELRIRKGRKVYRFICCGVGELRFTAPARPEVLIYIAPDATVRELKRSIPYIINSQEI